MNDKPDLSHYSHERCEVSGLWWVYYDSNESDKRILVGRIEKLCQYRSMVWLHHMRLRGAHE